jgi:hypothetical protein
MHSNFEHINEEVFFEDLQYAERFAKKKPVFSGLLLRRCFEIMLIRAYRIHDSLILPRDRQNIVDLVNTDSFSYLVEETSFPGSQRAWDKIRTLGNKANHEVDRAKFTQDDALTMLKSMHSFSYWYQNEVLDDDVEPVVFSEEFLPNELPENELTKQFEEAITAKDEQHKEALELLESSIKEKDDLIEELKAGKSDKVHFLDVGITEKQHGSSGRLYINFKYFEERYYAVKYPAPESANQYRLYIRNGRYQQSPNYRSYELRHPGLSTDAVLSGTFDKIQLGFRDNSQNLLPPSALLRRLVNEVESEMNRKRLRLLGFESSRKLALDFDFFGSYYTHEGSSFRNLLTIKSKSSDNTHYDAIVVMLTPGSSKPLDESKYQLKTPLDIDKTNLVPCVPDDTQYQICRLMKLMNWKQVAVVNLFDYCEPNSSKSIARYENKALLSESIFHKERREELSALFAASVEQSPIVLGWGVNKEWALFRKSIYEKVLLPLGREIVGLRKGSSSFEYYHPWPRGGSKMDFKMSWAPEIAAQLNSRKTKN